MTGALKAKVNGEWVPIPVASDPALGVTRWNSAWGVLGVGNFSFSPSAVLGSGATITHQLNWQAYAGRRYLLHLQIRAVGSDGTGSAFTIQLKNHGNVYSTSDMAWWRFYSQWDTKHATWLFEPSSDQTYGIQLFCTNIMGVAPTIYSSGPSYYYVEDVGPAVPATVTVPIGTPVAVAAGNAIGVIARGFPRADQPVSTSASVNVPLTYTLTWRSIAGRRYRIVFNARAVTTGSIRIFPESNGALHPGSNDRYVSAYTSYNGMYCDWLIDGDNTDWSTTIVAGPGSVMQWYPTEFYIEDVGPNTSPALPVPETPPAWTALTTFVNGWTPYGSGTGWQVPQIRKIGDMVHIRGSCSGGTATQGTVMCTLPVGFRPPATISMVTEGAASFKWMLINSAGQVMWYGATAGENGSFHFNHQFCTTP